MRLTRVDSSMIYAIRYDEEMRTLEVVFNDGGIYRYLDVPRRIYRELMNADSKGLYMHDYVIGFYDYVRVRRERGSVKSRS
jgi:hypothetical protein